MKYNMITPKDILKVVASKLIAVRGLVYNKKNKFLYVLPYAIIGVLSFCVLKKIIGDGDEIWNYNFARCIAEGRVPYTDFNMVQTPLSAYISSIFLMVFGESLLSFRLASALLMALTFSMLYTICADVSDNKTLSFVASLFVFSLSFDIWIYNYNNLNLFLILMLLYLERKAIKNNSRLSYSIFIGLIYGVTPIVKQSTGAILLIANLIISLLDYIVYKKDRIHIASRVISSAVPGTVFLLLILFTGTFRDFYDYAINGIGYFTHRISLVQYAFSSPVSFCVALFPFFVTVRTIVCIYKERISSKKRLLIVGLLLAIAGSVVAYPLCDSIHMYVAIIPFIPCTFACMIKKHMPMEQKIACVFVALIVAVCSILMTIPLSSDYKESQLHHFAGLPIERGLEKNIQEVNDYILSRNKTGIEVRIADEYAAVYMIPLDRYNKNYDLLLVGNLGSNSIEDLISENDVIYLVRRDESSLGYQAHFKLIEYIKDNFKKIGEVQQFDVYEGF